jgi:hypothetical protein
MCFARIYRRLFNRFDAPKASDRKLRDALIAAAVACRLDNHCGGARLCAPTMASNQEMVRLNTILINRCFTSEQRQEAD